MNIEIIEALPDLVKALQRVRTALAQQYKTQRALKPSKTSTMTSSNKAPSTIMALQQPSGVFPPDIWLHILESCSTTSLKNISLTSKTLHGLALEQLIQTLVLGQNILGTCTLNPSLTNATLIKDPAAFCRAVLENKHLRWYRAVKTVFVVWGDRLYVIRVSALPLVCYYITWKYAPKDLVKYTWKVWVKTPATVTLWSPRMWPVKHAIMHTLDDEC